MKNCLGLAIALLGTQFLVASSGWAATETQNLSVSATVTNTCEVSSSNTLAFGAVEPSSSTPTNSQVTITINCSASPGTATLAVGDGQNGGIKSGFTDARSMLRTGGVSGTEDDLLAYRLYTDAGRAAAISLAAGSTEIIDLTEGTSMNTVIYGQVPGNQTVGSSAANFNNAAFADTVLLTLVYTP